VVELTVRKVSDWYW